MSDAIKDRYGYDTEKHPRLAYDVADPVMGVGTLSISDWEDDCMGVMLQGKVAADEIQRLRRQLDTARETLRECVTTMDHARVFVNSRERIKQPEGRDLYDEALAGARRTLAALDGEDQT